MAVVQRFRCQVKRIVDHGERVYTVDLTPERPVPRFHPGQFLHLALDDYDPAGFWPDSRVFSIASSPRERNFLRLVFSVRGRFTGRMEKELQEGRWVWVKMPYGELVIGRQSDVVLFAGGTGITAFTAFLGELRSDCPHSVHLAYGARTRNLLIFRQMLDEMARHLPQFRVSYFIEKAAENLTGSQVNRSTEEIPGLLSAGAIWEQIPRPLESTYYVSGPPPMLKTISRELGHLGVPPDAIKIDAWD